MSTGRSDSSGRSGPPEQPDQLALVRRVRALLAEHRDVTEQRMMGALAFMVGGAMCCSVGPSGLLVRVDADDREALLARAHVTAMTLGKRTMRGFVRVEPAGYRSKAALARWLEAGIAAATAKPPKDRARPASSAKPKPAAAARRR